VPHSDHHLCCHSQVLTSVPQVSTAVSEARAAVTAHMEALRMRSSSTQSSSTTGAGGSAPGSRQQSQDAGAAQVCILLLCCCDCGEGCVLPIIMWHAVCSVVMPQSAAPHPHPGLGCVVIQCMHLGSTTVDSY
jgi:hypothetical protein